MRRHVARSSCALAVVLAASAAAFAQGQQRWYDAYDLGIKAVQSRDWKTAETYLVQARHGGPKVQGRRLLLRRHLSAVLPRLLPGNRVLEHQSAARSRECVRECREAQFDRSKKDPQYAQLQPSLRRATFDRSFREAQQALSANNLDEAEKRVMEAKATNVDTKRIDAFVAEL